MKKKILIAALSIFLLAAMPQPVQANGWQNVKMKWYSFTKWVGEIFEDGNGLYHHW